MPTYEADILISAISTMAPKRRYEPTEVGSCDTSELVLADTSFGQLLGIQPHEMDEPDDLRPCYDSWCSLCRFELVLGDKIVAGRRPITRLILHRRC